jgi:hypothetical protein
MYLVIVSNANTGRVQRRRSVDPEMARKWINAQVRGEPKPRRGFTAYGREWAYDVPDRQQRQFRWKVLCDG